MLNLRPFQIALLAIFTGMAILAVILLRLVEPSSPINNSYGEVYVWGSIDPEVFRVVKSQIAESDSSFSKVEYFYVDERTLDEELVNAIAEGRSPDLIIFPADSLVKHRAKLLALEVDERTFRDTYLDAGEIFLLSDGQYAFPFLIDPLVMYWNRDLYGTGGLAQPPQTWEQMVSSAVPSLTIRDTSRNIIQAALAFGEYRNVTNAKEVLLAMTMQSGSRLVSENERGYVVELDKPLENGGRAPMSAALEFFTDFSNSNSPLYTWNRALATDENAFVAEDLATYIGFGSDAERLAAKNPNLNLDIAELPQGAGATIKRTYGRVYGIGIPRGAFNQNGAYQVAQIMTSSVNAARFAEATNMAAANRTSVITGTASPYRQIIERSALVARAWLDPDPSGTETIFQQMIEDVVSNRTRVVNAVGDAVRRISLEY